MNSVDIPGPSSPIVVSMLIALPLSVPSRRSPGPGPRGSLTPPPFDDAGISSIRPTRTSLSLLDPGSRSWPQGQETCCVKATGPEDVRWRIYRAAVRGTAARVYQVRAATPGGQDVPHRRGRQRTTYRTWPAEPLRSASGSGSRSTAGMVTMARSSRASGPGPDAPATALEVASPGGRSTRTVERQVARHRLDLLAGDRPHRPRSQGTSPATAAARRPQSAPGSPSTVPVSSPAARDAAPEDERRSTAGRSPMPSLTPRSAAARPPLPSAGRTSSLREAHGPWCGMVRVRHAAVVFPPSVAS